MHESPSKLTQLVKMKPSFLSNILGQGNRNVYTINHFQNKVKKNRRIFYLPTHSLFNDLHF